MTAQFQTHTNPARAGSPIFRTNRLVQRKCACGGSPGVSGECAQCRENSLQRVTLNSTEATNAPAVVQRTHSSGTPPFTEQRLGHDFSRVQIHSRVRAGDGLPAHSKSLGSPLAINAPGGLREVFINGPGDQPKPAPNSPPPGKKDQTPPAKAGATCPSDIQVAALSPANDVDFGKDGFLTGWGGISIMEVSDPSGKTWDGTAIHENLRNIKNTCGNRGKSICSNKSGERGGTAGSTFKVGEESNFLGKAKLPAARNKFHDLHVMSTKEASLLHELKKDSCEVQCQQSYDCGGKRFGPDFIISYSMTRDVVKSGARNIDVTRVAMNKAPLVKQAAPAGDKT